MIILTTTQPSRFPLLLSTLSHAMTCVKDCEFVIQHYGEIEKFHLTHMAKVTNNLIQFNQQPDNRSVYHTKFAFTPLSEHTRWCNLDDDIIVSPKALLHHQDWTHTCLSTGVVDVHNGRGYDNWDLLMHPVKDAALYGDKAGYFFFDELKEYGNAMLTQLYSLPYSMAYSAQQGVLSKYIEVFRTLSTEYAVKGVRGYDVRLFKLLEPLTHCTHLLGVESFHLGVDTPFLNDTWTNFK